MKWLKYISVYYVMLLFILEVGSISNHPDPMFITENERRGADKLESAKSTLDNNKITDPQKRGAFLHSVFRKPGSFIHPSLAAEYETKDYIDDHRPALDDHDIHRPHYSESGSKLGYSGYFSSGHFPTQYGGGYGHGGGYGNGGVYGHSGGSYFGHSGPGSYEYPYGPGSDVGYHHSDNQGGFFKNPLALKGLLLPLAGIAILGAAAALTANPVLLQLGVVNGRRRKRGLIKKLRKNVYPTNHLLTPD